MLNEDIFRRRQAQKKKVRRQWLTSYFSAARQGLLLQNQTLFQEMSKCITQLPTSLQTLVKLLNTNQRQVIHFLLANFELFKQHLLDKNMSLKQWISYNFICQHLILNWDENEWKPQIIRIIFNSISGRGIVLCGKEKMVKKTILKDIVKMISLIQNGLIYLDHLDVILLSEIIRENISLIDIENESDQQSYQDTLLVMSMMLTAADSKDKQNIQEKKLTYVAWLKNQFINQTIFRDIRILKKIIKSLFLVKKEVLETLLSFLVNMTYFQKSQPHFLMLVEYQVYISILHVLANQSDQYILTLAIRLANNIIYSCHEAALKAQQSAILTVLIENSYRGKFMNIQNEIYQLVGNYISDNIKFEQSLQYINKKQLHLVLLNWLVQAQKYEVQTTIRILEAFLKILEVQEQIVINELIKKQKVIQQLYQSENLDVEHYCDLLLNQIKQFKNKTHDYIF